MGDWTCFVQPAVKWAHPMQRGVRVRWAQGYFRCFTMTNGHNDTFRSRLTTGWISSPLRFAFPVETKDVFSRVEKVG
jgi:hypothetical protein